MAPFTLRGRVVAGKCPRKEGLTWPAIGGLWVQCLIVRWGYISGWRDAGRTGQNTECLGLSPAVIVHGCADGSVPLLSLERGGGGGVSVEGLEAESSQQPWGTYQVPARANAQSPAILCLTLPPKIDL
ncbi:MAG: hypothetical protein FRX49_12455 [Trebouxia sp. A1-2]|nr:MAG: hypothetical protein FRX49_12455 [Trebouxia sp. A1-2]